MLNKIEPEYWEIINMIRGLYNECGGNSPQLEESEEYHEASIKSETGGVEIAFDNGIPRNVLTPRGNYWILLNEKSSMSVDTKKFWDQFNKTFNVEILRPQMSDARESDIEYSGPYVKITKRA